MAAGQLLGGRLGLGEVEVGEEEQVLMAGEGGEGEEEDLQYLVLQSQKVEVGFR